MVNREIRSRPSSWGRYTRERCPLSGPECRMPQGKPRSIPNSGLYTYLLQPHGATTRLLNSNSIHARRTTELTMGSLADRPTPVPRGVYGIRYLQGARKNERHARAVGATEFERRRVHQPQAPIEQRSL